VWLLRAAALAGNRLLLLLLLPPPPPLLLLLLLPAAATACFALLLTHPRLASRSAPQPHRINGFDFELGARAVIAGWDIGFAHMKVGEKAVLTLAPEYGYGAAGAGGVIPPNATLTFEVELLNVTDQ